MFSADRQLKNTTPFLCRATCAAAVMLLCCLPALTWSAVREPALDELKLEVDQLQGRVAYLEEQLRNVLQLVAAGPDTNKPAQANAQPQPAPATPVIATASDSREYALVTTMDNSAINVGGKLKLDAIYNSHSTGENSGSNPGDLSFIPAAIPLTSSGEDDQFSFSARQTRLWLKGYSPSDYGEMAGYIEIDFDAASSASNEKVSNSYVPRLRHAYGTIGSLTLGQTYTTFMNVAAFPEVNDLNGPVAIVHIRQPLFSYSMQRDWGNLIIAMENPEATLSTATGKHIAPDDDRLPDVIGKVEFTGDWGNWSLSGMAREIRSDGAVLANIEDSVWGGAASASGRIRLADQDNLRFNLSYGNALGRYLSYNVFDDGVIDASGRIHLTPVLGGYVALQHWWTEELRSTATAGFAQADHAIAADPGSVNNMIYSTHLNLIWSPSLNASIGIEWLHGYRELEDGRNGELDRIQLTSLYRF